ncbi:MAG: hypothetical protein V9G20_29495 [Candidatus Promineifilaceae bacterium]
MQSPWEGWGQGVLFRLPHPGLPKFPMGLRRTKMNENDATIFIPIRVSSYPCFHHQWLFSQENTWRHTGARQVGDDVWVQ